MKEYMNTHTHTRVFVDVFNGKPATILYYSEFIRTKDLKWSYKMMQFIVEFNTHWQFSWVWVHVESYLFNHMKSRYNELNFRNADSNISLVSK